MGSAPTAECDQTRDRHPFDLRFGKQMVDRSLDAGRPSACYAQECKRCGPGLSALRDSTESRSECFGAHRENHGMATFFVAQDRRQVFADPAGCADTANRPQALKWTYRHHSGDLWYSYRHPTTQISDVSVRFSESRIISYASRGGRMSFRQSTDECRENFAKLREVSRGFQKSLIP